MCGRSKSVGGVGDSVSWCVVILNQSVGSVVLSTGVWSFLISWVGGSVGWCVVILNQSVGSVVLSVGVWSF